jgi:Cu/Ag efflux protein CusF
MLASAIRVRGDGTPWLGRSQCRGVAADATGKIKSVDANKDMIMLDNGSSYVVPKSVKLSDFKVGEKVTMIYNKTGDKFDVTSIKPAA